MPDELLFKFAADGTLTDQLDEALGVPLAAQAAAFGHRNWCFIGCSDFLDRALRIRPASAG